MCQKGILRQCWDDFDKFNIKLVTPTISRPSTPSTTVPSNITTIDVTSTNDDTTLVIIINTSDSTANITYATSIPRYTTEHINI